jgi:hypothetical protein
VLAERPWALRGADLARLRGAGLDDAAILHAVLQGSLFGHLNRIADAVGVDADYPDTFGAPRLVPETPAYLAPAPGEAPDPAPAAPPIELASRPGAIELHEAWRAHALDRDGDGGALDRAQRAVIAHAVAVRLGDASVPAAAPATELDHALVELADLVALAPWRLGPAAYARLRALGLADDAAIFDAVATASSSTVFSRIRVALAGFAR